MARPILQNVNIFDATRDKTFKFDWYGSALSACTLFIYNYDTDVRVYEGQLSISGTNYNYLLPQNTLDNDNSYYAFIRTYDAHGNESVDSNKIQFKCTIVPDFELDIEDGSVLNMTTLEISTLFEHGIDELKTLRFYLLDDNGNYLIKSNEIIYESSEDTIYRFVGLENNRSYSVYATCTTVEGFEIETTKKRITINCVSPNFGGECHIMCDSNNGSVVCSTAFVVVRYNGEKTFTYENSMINLTESSLYYDEGFDIVDCVNICLRLKNPKKNSTIFVGGNGVNHDIKAYLYYCEDKLMNGYKVGLNVRYGVLTYVTFSETFTLEEDEIFEIWITRTNNMYDVKIIKDSVDTTEETTTQESVVEETIDESVNE